MDVEAASMVASCRIHPIEDLNTSDHLPLTVSLYYSAYSGSQNEGIGRQLRIDWDEARRSGALDMFASEVQMRLAPLLVGVYDDPDQMSREIELVAGLLTDVQRNSCLMCNHGERSRLGGEMILLVVCAPKAELLGQHGRKPEGQVRGHYLTKRVDCIE